MAGMSLGTGTDSQSRRRRVEGAALPGARPVSPAPIGSPALRGAGRIGAPLEADPGRWSGAPAPALSLRWQRNGADIPGATGPRFTPGSQDDGARIRLGVVAENAAGQAEAFSPDMIITHAAPVAREALTDATFILNSGDHSLNAFPEFTGSALTFSVTGEGVSIDPASGMLTISTAALSAGIAVSVSASNSGGTASSGFRVKVIADPEIVAPALIAPPALAGTAVIGASLRLDPGVWSGVPTPELGFQWRRDAEDIPGATEIEYLVADSDDGADISAVVTARNAGGELVAQTETLAARHAAPLAAGSLADQLLDFGSGAALIETSGDFTGEALRFSVTGGGATIDEATGALSLPSDVLRAGENVRVSAENSGGTASSGFVVDVRAVPPALVALPSLRGTAVIGETVQLDPGVWSGAPEPGIAAQWLRDGEDIPGAEGLEYAPVAADDRAALSALVTARNEGGAVVVETAPLDIRYPAPVAAGALGDQVLELGAEAVLIETSGDFTGEALRFSVTGGGATIDEATGALSLPGDVARAGESVVVSAENSGGTASSGFVVDVRAPAGVAPALSGVTLPDQIGLVRGGAAVTLEAAPAFTGAVSEYEISGDGVTIDAATGRISFDLSVTRPAAHVTVRARNGDFGAVETGFQTSVAMAVIAQADISVSLRPDETGESLGTAMPAGFATWHFDLANPPAGMTRLWWRGDAHVEGQSAGSGYHPCVAHPHVANRWIARAVTPGDGAPRLRPFLYVDDPAAGSTNNVIGQEKTHHLIYSTDAETIAPLEAEYSAPSAAVTQVMRLEAAPAVSLLSRNVPLVEQEEWGVADYVPGDGLQQIQGFAYCLARPEYIYMNQDSGSLWCSNDFGQSWRRPRRFGLLAYQGLGAACDPVDPKRVFCSQGGSYPANKGKAGLYLSTDGGDTFSAKAINTLFDAQQGTFNAITHAPGSVGRQRAEKWLAILGGDIDNAVPDLAPVCRSVNGGEDWSILSTRWSQDSLGLARYMAGDPSDDEVFYVSSSKGLIKVANAFGSISFTRITVVSGAATAGVGGPVHVSADGQTIIAGIEGRGVYRTTNAKAASPSWSKLGSQSVLRKLWVNPFDPRQMIVSPGEATPYRPYFSTDGGANWAQTSATGMERRPGVDASKEMRMTHVHNQVAFHSDGRVFLCGRQSSPKTGNNHFWSEDKGKTWKLSNAGYSGSNFFQRQQSVNMFSPTDKNRLIVGYTDVSARLTRSGMKWFETTGMSQTLAGGETRAHGAAVHPDASTRRIFQAIGNNSGVLFVSEDDGASWEKAYGSVASAGYGIFFNRSDFSKAFHGRYRSLSGGKAGSWAVMSGLSSSDAVYGMTQNASGVNHVFTLSIGAALADISTVKRSSDNGASWSTVLSMGYSNAGSARHGPFMVDCADGNVVYTRAPTGHAIRKWDLGSGTATSRSHVDLNLFGPGASQPAHYPAPIAIGAIAQDPRHPEVLYASTLNGGQPMVFRSIDGGMSPWTPLDDRLPSGCKINALAVHPLTGEFFCGTENGLFLVPPPYAQTGLLFDELPYDSYLGAGA